MKIVYLDASENIKRILSEDLLKQLKDMVNFELFTGTPRSNEEAIARIGDADGIIFGKPLANEVIAACENLKFMSFVGYGVRNYIDVDFVKARSITVTNTPSYGDNAVAEHALTLLLSLTKNIVKNHNRMQKGIWNQNDHNNEVHGKTIGLVGLGTIGERMAILCKALGMNVIVWTFHPDEARSKRLGVNFVTLNELFSQSDFISLHLPYTAETKEMIGENELSLLKENTLFINTARAEIVQTNVLMKYLLNGTISGAALDVFDQEPIEANHPFLTMENVILSPHVAFNTPESIKNMLEIAINNVVHYLNHTTQNIV